MRIRNGGGGGGFGGFGDIFDDLFGGGSRRGGSRVSKGANLRARVNITFAEAMSGVKKELDISLKESCPTCGGTGAKPGTSPENIFLEGQGLLVVRKNFVIYGSMVSPKGTDLNGVCCGIGAGR